MVSLTQYTKAEIEAHSKASSLWIVIEKGVYDVTRYLSEHPGGAQALLRNGGKDASKMFALTHGEAARQKLLTFKIGEVAEDEVSHQTHEVKKPTEYVDTELKLFKSSVLLSKKETEGKSSVIRIQNPDKEVFTEDKFPSFGHVSIMFRDANQSEIRGMYSPSAITNEYVEIVVKPAGPKSILICNIAPDTEIWISSPLSPNVSPDRTTPFLRIRPVHVAFLAAGSGVTPFFRPLRAMLATNPSKVPTVTFILCQRTSEHQVGVSILKELEHQATTKQPGTPGFHLYRHYTQENEKSHRIRKCDLLGYGAAFMTQVYICGPVGFNRHITTLFMELGFLPSSIQVIE